MRKSLFSVVPLFVSLSLGLHAQWSNNSAVNTPLAVGKSGRYDLYAVNDGAGNTFMTWYDGASDSNAGVFCTKDYDNGNVAVGVGGDSCGLDSGDVCDAFHRT